MKDGKYADSLTTKPVSNHKNSVKSSDFTEFLCKIVLMV